MVPMGPIILALGAAGVMLLVSTSKAEAKTTAAKETPPALPPATVPSTTSNIPGAIPPVDIPGVTSPVKTTTSLVVPSSTTPTPAATPASMAILISALDGVNPTLLNQALDREDTTQETLMWFRAKLDRPPFNKDPLVLSTIAAIDKKAASALTGREQMRAKEEVAIKTPGVWQGLDADKQKRVATLLKALKVDPVTGAVSPGTTADAVKAATAFAGELDRLGLKDAAASLRAYAAAAAKTITVAKPTAYDALPKELADAMARVSELEGDPKKIREFLGKLKPYAHLPQVASTITVLEGMATKAENAQRIADALAKIEAAQNDLPEPPTPEPPGMPAVLQATYDKVINGLGVEDGKLTTAPTQAAVDLANNAGHMLQANGYPSEGAQLLKYAAEGAALLKAAKPATTTTTKPAVVTPPIPLPTTTTTKPAVVTPPIPLPTTTTTTSTVPATYTVKKGDMPISVAKQFGQPESAWRELQAANPQYKFGTQFWAGMVLTIPPKWRTGGTVLELPTVTITATPPTTPVVTPVVTPVATVLQPLVYTVKSGDWGLSKIATTLTGDGSRWKELIPVNPDKTAHKTAGFIFHVGDKINLPESWRSVIQSRGITVSGIPENTLCMGLDCGCVGAYCSGQDAAEPLLQVHFEERGPFMYAHGYLNDEKGVRIFTTKVDMRPIARALRRFHKRLHEEMADDDVVKVSGDTIDILDGSVEDPPTFSGLDIERSLEVGSRRSRRRRRKARRARRRARGRGVFRKLGRTVKRVAKKATPRFVRKIAKSKAMRKIARTARDVIDPRRYSFIKKTGLAVTAAVMPPVGVPALKAYSKAKSICDKIHAAKQKAKRIIKKVKTGIKTGLKLAKGVGKFAKKAVRTARTKLLRKAHRKGLFKKFSPKRIGSAIKKLSTRFAKKKLGALFRKAPHLKKKLSKALALRKKLRLPKARQAIRKLTSGATKTQVAVQNMLEKARRGDKRAKKAARILATVAKTEAAMKKASSARISEGTRGTIIDRLGRIQRGRFRRTTNKRGGLKTLVTKRVTSPGYYERVGLTSCRGC